MDLESTQKIICHLSTASPPQSQQLAAKVGTGELRRLNPSKRASPASTPRDGIAEFLPATGVGLQPQRPKQSLSQGDRHHPGEATPSVPPASPPRCRDGQREGSDQAPNNPDPANQQSPRPTNGGQNDPFRLALEPDRDTPMEIRSRLLCPSGLGPCLEAPWNHATDPNQPASKQPSKQGKSPNQYKPVRKHRLRKSLLKASDPALITPASQPAGRRWSKSSPQNHCKAFSHLADLSRECS
jgi:hypothetical protein